MADVTTLPITGATASDSAVLGTPSVSNVAQGSLVQGFRADAVGALSLGLSNAAIDLSFDFTEKYEKLTGQVRMRFSGPIVQPSITLGDCSGFGQLGIVNAAQATNTVGGIKQEAYGIPAAFYANTAHALNLNFVTPLEIVTGDYVPFFTGPRPIAPESFESLVFGGVKIDSPIDAKPFGFDTSSFGLGMVINVGEGLSSINFERNTDKTDSISLRLDFGTGPRPIVPFGIDAPVLGTESELLNTADALYLEGILSTAYGMATIATSDSAHSFDLNFQRNLVEQNPLNVPFYFAERGSIKPYAIYSEEFGEHKIETRDSVVSGVGGITLADAFGVPRLYGTQFIKHQGFNANLIPLHTVFNLTQIAYTTGITPGDIGTANIINRNRYITATGFSAAQYGTARLHNDTQIVRHAGALATAFGNLNARNLNRPLPVQGFTGSFYGRPLVYNLRQYIRAAAFTPSLYGHAYLLGGVKYVNLSGFNASAVSQPGVVNTRADRVLKPSSIGPVNFPSPTVSPRILYPKGILAWSFGIPIVQRNPSPKGFTNDGYGNAWISHSPRYITPTKVEAFLPGYGKVYDPTQRIYHEGSPHIPGGIFGDIAIRNTRRILKVSGEDQSQYGDWTNIYSNLTFSYLVGIDSQAFGAATIWNKTPSLGVSGQDQQRFGDSFISERVRRINARGIEFAESQRFGRHDISKPPEMFPAGFASAQYGQAQVTNRTRYIYAGGFNSLNMQGDIKVWFKARYVYPSGHAHQAFASAKVEHAVRNLVTRGADHSALGRPITWYRVRTLQPASIFREFESNHRVGGTQFIQPGGFDATRFGSRVVPENQSVYPFGFNSQGFSELNQIELHTRWVRATGFHSYGQQTSDRYGVARVWNLRQYITQNYDSAGGLSPGEFGIWTAVANRNRNIGPVGFNATRFGYHNIANKAVPLYPKGEKFDSYGSAMVAYRIRKVKPDAIEAPYMSGWGRIFNSAFVIAPGTGVHSSYGHPTVINTRREYRWVGAFESMLFGVPMVAFRIRSLSIESRYSIAPVYLPIPKFDLHTRYIEPIGPDLNAFGGPSLHIKWNIVTTRWTHRELFGDPSVRNLTPELKQRGNSTDEFGQAGVRLQKQYYGLDGFGTELWGRHHIAYRDRSISVPGTNTFGMGKILVTKTGAPPYSEQRITLDWPGEGERPDDFEGNGIAPLRDHVGRPSLKTNVVFASGFMASTYGSHHLQSNGILLDAGIQEFAIGDHFVGLKNRTIQVPTLGDFGTGIEGTRPSVSPHTIYAVTEAPAQAIQNHYKHGSLHYVNSDRGNRAPGEVFGNARVTLRHRQILLHGYNYIQGAVGRPSLQLRKRYIRPTGINMFRMGWHSALDGSPQDLVQYNDAAQTAYGRPSVVSPYYGPQTVRVSGLNAFNSGSNRVEFFHRPVYPRAFLATAMGASRSGDTPYKPQGLWVGKPMPTIPTGFNAERFGNTTIGLRVRDVSVEGFDSFASELDISNFKGRLKVTLVKQPTLIEPQAVAVLPYLSETGYGIPDIKLKVHYIRPDGNSDQYRKGGPQ